MLLSSPHCLADFVSSNAADLVQLMFQTLPYYRDATSQRAVLHFLKPCLQNETFLKAMAGALVRLGPHRLPRQDAYALLCWSSAVVRHLELPAARKALSKIAECQVGPWTLHTAG